MTGRPGMSALAQVLGGALGRFYLQPTALELGTIVGPGLKLRADSYTAHDFDLLSTPVQAYVTPLAYFDLASPNDPKTVITSTVSLVEPDNHAHGVELPFVWKPLEIGERVIVGWLANSREPTQRGDPYVFSRALRAR